MPKSNKCRKLDYKMSLETTWGKSSMMLWKIEIDIKKIKGFIEDR